MSTSHFPTHNAISYYLLYIDNQETFHSFQQICVPLVMLFHSIFSFSLVHCFVRSGRLFGVEKSSLEIWLTVCMVWFNVTWLFFGEHTSSDRMEPQCITCDIDRGDLWNSRRLYGNCTYFEAYLSPASSIATDYRIEQYVLECQGPMLPVAGKKLIFVVIFIILTVEAND